MSSVEQDKCLEGDKNPHKIICKRCKCLLLRPLQGSFVSLKEELPFMEVDANDPKKTETLTSFWEVDDIFTFENMGFSLNVEDKKYLACPECELGPLGFQNLNTKKSFLSKDRVTEEVESTENAKQ